MAAPACLAARARQTGVIPGAALIQVIRNGVVLLGLPNQNQWQLVTIGAMILWCCYSITGGGGGHTACK
jgi:ribose/xylose/arabinose/galactoside ABC-type transport system permease subunit